MMYPGALRRANPNRNSVQQNAPVKLEMPQPSPPQNSDNSTDKPKPPELTSELSTLAQQAQNINTNLPVVIAEVTVFSGLVLLGWAKRVRQSERVMATAKLLLALGFVLLYPMYAAISALIMASIYLSSRKYRLP